jgi:hypothetical protein
MRYFLSRTSLAALTLFLAIACDSGQKSDSQTDTTAAVSDTTSAPAAPVGNTATGDVPAGATNATAINTLTDQEKADGWKLLFDGQSTNGWRGYTKKTFPEKGWEVKDGMLTVLASKSGEEGGGDIITENQYENFDFKFDFMYTPEANSGVLYRVKEVPNTPSWHSAPEYQVIDNAGWAKKNDPSFNMDTHRTGDNYDVHAAPADYSKPAGEWNEGRIVVNNGKVEHWLNGKQTVTYDFNSKEWKDLVKKTKFATYKDYGANAKGHIGIQDHGATVSYRNIKIKEL